MGKQLSKNIVTLLLVLWAVLLPASALLAAEPDLVLTGTGLREDVVIYPGDWGRYKEVIRYYSSNNTMDYHRIWKVKGYDLETLMGGESNIKSGNHDIIFIAADKASMTKKRWDLFDRYYHENFTKPIPVAPMVAFYRADVFQHSGLPDPGEVVLQDRPFERDGKAPRIYLGQRKGEVSEQTHTIFIRCLVRIVVGEERPEGEKQVETDRDTASGGATGGKTEASETAPGKADAQDDDPVSGTDPEENGKADEPGEQNGATAPEEEPDSAAAAGPGSAKDSDSEELSGEQPRKVRWPWIAAGLILAGGAAGGAYYYHFRKRSA